jgi:hypothetical protein
MAFCSGGALMIVRTVNGLSDHDAQYLMMNNIFVVDNFAHQKQRTRK